MNTALSEVIETYGLTSIASACGVTYQSVKKWATKGFPRTEWTGETNHSGAIADLTGGKVTREQLLNADPRILAAAG